MLMWAPSSWECGGGSPGTGPPFLERPVSYTIRLVREHGPPGRTLSTGPVRYPEKGPRRGPDHQQRDRHHAVVRPGRGAARRPGPRTDGRRGLRHAPRAADVTADRARGP